MTIRCWEAVLAGSTRGFAGALAHPFPKYIADVLYAGLSDKLWFTLLDLKLRNFYHQKIYVFPVLAA